MAARRVLGWFLAVGVGVSGALLAPSASAADGESPPAVRVLGRPMETSLHLAGASEYGVAVQQGSDTGDYADTASALVYTGVEGDELTARPAIKARGAYDAQPLLLGVAGNQLGWAEPIGSSPEVRGWYLHRMEVDSGTDVIDAPAATPDVFTGSAWFTTDSFTRTGPADLLLHRAGTGAGGPDGEMNIVNLLKGTKGAIDVAATEYHALVALADPPLPEEYEDDPAPPGTRKYKLVLVDLDTQAAETIVESTDVISSVALNYGRMAWDSQASGQPRRIYTRGLYLDEGPALASYVEDDPDADSVDLVMGMEGVGYLVDGPAPEGTFPVPPAKDVELRVVNGENATTTELPDYSSGLAAVGDRFLTATGGPKKVAGVYSVSPGDVPVRTATVPMATTVVKDFALGGSSLYTLDRTASADGRHSVWQTPVSGTPSAGTTKRFGVDGIGLSEFLFDRTDREFAFSAGRGVIRDSYRSWNLVDRGKVTGTVAARSEWTDLHPVVSGPYALVETTVVKPNGDPVYEVKNSEFFGGRAALFGSTIIYSLDPSYDEETGAYESRVWLDDVENPDPEVLATPENCSYRPPYVAVWGETAAWTACDYLTITVRNLRTGVERVVENPFGNDYAIYDLQLSEGVLFWANWAGEKADQYGGHLLDLTDPGSERVDLLGDWLRTDTDDHLLARSLDGRGGVEIQRLPFTAQYRPRLIGKLAGTRFVAGTGVFRPRFDFSKPLVDVRLVVTNSQGTTVRTLAGTAPDGSIRDIAWDGRDRNGRKVTPGAYHWRLLGKAADGDGALIGKFGASVVSGQVRVTG